MGASENDWFTLVNTCPPLKVYPKEDLKRVAGEIAKLPHDSATREFLTDYAKMREACRVVEGMRTEVRKTEDWAAEYHGKLGRGTH